MTPNSLHLIRPAARRAMARAIADYEYCESFFLGDTDASGAVTHVELLAVGNRQATAALTNRARPGQVMIHNHPNGNLMPSLPDIELSSQVGQRGVGSLIVNNDVTACRFVVKPDRGAPAVPSGMPIAAEKAQEPFAIDPDTLYGLDALRQRLAGLVTLETLLDRLGLRERRIFRDALFGWEILDAARRAAPYSEKPDAALPLPAPRTRPARPAANPRRRLNPDDLRRT